MKYSVKNIYGGLLKIIHSEIQLEVQTCQQHKSILCTCIWWIRKVLHFCQRKKTEQIDYLKLHSGINWKMNNNEIKVSDLLPSAKVAFKSIVVL